MADETEVILLTVTDDAEAPAVIEVGEAILIGPVGDDIVVRRVISKFNPTTYLEFLPNGGVKTMVNGEKVDEVAP